MHHVLATPLAVLLQFQAVLERLLILVRVVIDTMTVGAFQTYEVVLGHNM